MNPITFDAGEIADLHQMIHDHRELPTGPESNCVGGAGAGAARTNFENGRRRRLLEKVLALTGAAAQALEANEKGQRMSRSKKMTCKKCGEEFWEFDAHLCLAEAPHGSASASERCDVCGEPAKQRELGYYVSGNAVPVWFGPCCKANKSIVKMHNDPS